MTRILIVGSLNMDTVLEVAHLPAPGETVLSRSKHLVPGGKGANAAFAAGRLGGDAALLGCVGRDEPGRLLLESLRGAGVDVSGVRQLENVDTGCAVIQVENSGENCITVAQGANLYTDQAFVQDHVEAIDACEVLLLQLEIPFSGVLAAAERANSRGKTVILDPAPARTDLPEALFRAADYVKPNQGELSLLTGCDPEEYVAGAHRLQQKGARNVLVSLGEQGAYLLEEDGRETRIPAYVAGPTVDTTAAGDCFTAAFACGLCRGLSRQEAVRFAAVEAGIAVTRKGAQPSIPTLEEVLAHYS